MNFLALFGRHRSREADENTQNIRLLDWQVCAQTCTLENLQTGENVRITPRGMEVLSYLMQRPHKVIHANELLETFWSKSVRSDHAVHNVIAELRGALGDQASAPRFIKTYPKRGYALIVDPRIDTHEAPDTAPPTKDAESTRFPLLGSGHWAFTTAAIVLMISSVLLGKTLFSPPLADADGQRTLLVQAFDTLNLDAGNLYLSQQLPGSLVSRLSKIPNAQVVVGQGSFDEGVGVDYLLNGSIQQEAGTHRVQVNLTDAKTQVILFSDQFNFSSEEIFNIQDQIVQHVVIALRVILDESLQNDMRDWGTLSALAYDAFLKGEFYANSTNHEDLRLSMENYQRAIDHDPDFENAYVGLANAATQMGMYSHQSTNVALRKQVDFALRELRRIDPHSENAKAAQILALRVEGNNQHLIETKLRDMILAGNPPDFALSHYSSLLATARMYREAEAYLSLIPDETPYQVSPDATWTYRDTIVKPQDLIAIKKQQLLERPAHLGILGSLARSYAFLGEADLARHYLAQQMEVDSEGPSSMLSQVIISALYGHSTLEGDRFEAENNNNPDFNFAFGVKAFVQGNVEEGIARWHALSPAETRRLYGWLSYAVIFFPDAVLEDSRYHELLDELGLGIAWQKHMMESVMKMAKVTGIPLSEESRAAYAQDKVLTRNNLWNHEEICYLCARNTVSSLSPMDHAPH